MELRISQVLRIGALFLVALILTISPNVHAQAPERAIPNPLARNERAIVAGSLYVAPGGDGDCSAWAEACALQTALGMATAGDEIWVAQGLYKPTDVPTDTLATFLLPSGVALYGGFDGTETRREQRDWENNLTVLSGDIDNNDLSDSNGVITNTRAITGTNSYHVVSGIALTETAVLDGFTITGGRANGQAGQDTYGGGLLNAGSPTNSSNLTIANSRFSGNVASSGGGIGNLYGPLSLTNSVLSNNRARAGGGMYNLDASSTSLADVSFSGNVASVEYPQIEGASGGGMYNDHSIPELSRVEFISNTLEVPTNGGIGYGGGMYNLSSSPVLKQVLFKGNGSSQSYIPSYIGGGMYNQDSDPYLEDVVFDGNLGEHGAGMVNDNSNPTLINVSFENNQNNGKFSAGPTMENYQSNPLLINVLFRLNSSAGQGSAVGGMSNAQSNPMLVNVVFDRNWASSFNNSVGVMYNGGSPMLVNVTFSGNQAYEYENTTPAASGIYNAAGSELRMSNSILWGVTPTDTSQIIVEAGSAITISNSLIAGGCPGGAVCSGTLLDQDPQFIDAPGGDVQLRPASPAVDAGDNSMLPADAFDLDGDGDTTEPIPYDLLGMPRQYNGVVDMGAVEYNLWELYLPLVY
jgi:hypothetical protein